MIGAGVVVLLVIAVLAVHRLSGAGGTAAGTAKSSKAVALTFTLSSFDPSGGSGLRHQGSSWTTQTYRSATFGNLKPGVGLVLDLGSARSVSQVTFDAGSGPLQVALRAGDQASASLSGFGAVGASTSADGTTTLSGTKGGKHRYWMIWVTRLGTGNKAVLSAVKASGPSA